MANSNKTLTQLKVWQLHKAFPLLSTSELLVNNGLFFLHPIHFQHHPAFVFLLTSFMFFFYLWFWFSLLSHSSLKLISSLHGGGSFTHISGPIYKCFIGWASVDSNLCCRFSIHYPNTHHPFCLNASCFSLLSPDLCQLSALSHTLCSPGHQQPWALMQALSCLLYFATLSFSAGSVLSAGHQQHWVLMQALCCLSSPSPHQLFHGVSPGVRWQWAFFTGSPSLS